VLKSIFSTSWRPTAMRMNKCAANTRSGNSNVPFKAV